MMPDTDFTRNFVGMSGGFGNFTNASLVGNFLVNLLLSGAMNLLWGLLHALQIVAHFPLINLMMPGNAQFLFQIIVKIATFDILPTEELIQDAEDSFGIENEEYILTDTFVDYGFDSSDPIRNLQVMFIFICFLVLYPVLSVAIMGLCFWSDRCTRCRRWADRKMYFNTYIRFFLETFLELSITVLLRLKLYDFETGSDKFHTVSATILGVALVLFILMVAIYPQTKFKNMDSPDFSRRFGDMVLGLNFKTRVAVAQPVLFVLRRCFYALIVVFWVDRSYF